MMVQFFDLLIYLTLNLEFYQIYMGFDIIILEYTKTTTSKEKEIRIGSN